MKFKVRVFKSKKSGNKAFALICDLGYAVKYITFDINLIAEIMGLSVATLYEQPEGDYSLKESK